MAQNRDGKNFIGELVTCFKGSDGYKVIMEGYVMYGPTIKQTLSYRSLAISRWHFFLSVWDHSLSLPGRHD